MTAAVCELMSIPVMSNGVACRAEALCEGWRHLESKSRDSSTLLGMTTNKRADAVTACRLSSHYRMKVGRVVRAANQWARRNVEKTFSTRDVAVIIELVRRDVFNHRQMFRTRAQILTHRQHLAADLTQIVHRLKKFGLFFAETKH